VERGSLVLVKEINWSTFWLPSAIGPGRPVCEQI
jgi:hypothetical protein